MKSVIESNLIIPDKSAEEILNTTFVTLDQVKILTAVRRAYANTNFVMHDDSSIAKWLGWGRGDFALESRIKQIAVEGELCRLIENGNLSFDYEFRWNTKHNYKYLIVKNKNFHLVVNQCSNEYRPAKKSKYRESENTNFQTRFDFSNDFEHFIDKPASNEYFELNHGFKSIEPKFVCLGIPKKRANEWAYKVNLINSNVILKSNNYKTKISDVNPVTPDEFATYQKRESNE